MYELYDENGDYVGGFETRLEAKEFAKVIKLRRYQIKFKKERNNG